MVINVYTLEEYAQLPEAQRKKVQKDQLKTLIDNHLINIQPITIESDPNDIRNLITTTITDTTCVRRKDKRIHSQM